MSGLEAFSMVCNVMTVISFGLETAKLCRSIRDSGSSDPELDKHAKWIRENSEQLLTTQRSANTDAEKRLQDVASECRQCAEDLVKEVDYISPKNTGKRTGLFRAMKSTAKTIRRRPHLDQLKGRLETSRNTMNSVVIGQILERCVESGKLNAKSFKTVIQEQEVFKKAHEQRSQVLEDLIIQLHDGFKSTITKACERIEDKIDLIEARKDEKQARETLLDSLDYDVMNERWSAIESRHESTFEWIFEGLKSEGRSKYNDPEPWSFMEHGVPSLTGVVDVSVERSGGTSHAKWAMQKQRDANLLGWLQGDSRDLYWISGKPGSGKSTLMKFIINDDRTKTALQSWRSQPKIISHFLWKPGTHLQSSLRGMLCSLIWQILMVDERIGDRLIHDKPSLKRKRRNADWDVGELKNTLFDTFQATSHSYLVVLDGLDELSTPHAGMTELFGLLDKLTAEDRVKLCVSSRPERLFEERFSSGRLLRMQDLTYQDILNYTLATLNDTALEGKADDNLKDLIVNEIMMKSQGVFLWAHTVLQSVKRGISEFDESWHDIYGRITELPPDLMKLYRGMWSRLGEDSKRYVRQAALYFQLIRYPDYYLHWSIAHLAVASDDKILDSFKGPETLPEPLELVERCEKTHKSLYSISCGLLEAFNPFSAPFPVHNETNDIVTQKCRDAVTEPIDKSSVDGLYLALSKWDGRGASIRFTHRTAIDFLDSDEGIQLFGEYKHGEDDSFSRLLRAGIILGCIPRSYHGTKNAFTTNFACVGWHCHTAHPLDGTTYVLLDLFRRCVEKISDFCNPPSGFSSHTFFIFSAAYFGLYEYVAKTLQATEDDYDAMVGSALIGACSLPNNEISDGSRGMTTSRHDLIKMCLESLPQSVTTPSENTMNAWRCFLRHFLPRAIGDMSLEEKTIAGNILEHFISAGVHPSRKYLIAVNKDSHSWWNISIPNPQEEFEILGPEEDNFNDSILYLEVNDHFLLRVLSDHIPATSEVIEQAAGLAFMRPVLGKNPGHDPYEKEMFTCSLSEDKSKVFEEWIFGEFIMQPSTETRFPGDVPSYLQLEELGAFRTVFDALEEIGYDLPEVNQNYLCWHDYAEFVP